VTDEIASGELVEVLPDYPRPTLSLYALYPERRLLPLKVRRLIDFLADWYSNPENTTHL
jgi:DNA-binding transcriptional LysR family regulator